MAADDTEEVTGACNAGFAEAVDVVCNDGLRCIEGFVVDGEFHQNVGLDHVEDFDRPVEETGEVDCGVGDALRSGAGIDGDDDRPAFVLLRGAQHDWFEVRSRERWLVGWDS